MVNKGDDLGIYEPLKTTDEVKAIIVDGDEKSCRSISFQPVTCLGVVNYPAFYTDTNKNEIDISKIDIDSMCIKNLQDKIIPLRDFARKF